MTIRINGVGEKTVQYISNWYECVQFSVRLGSDEVTEIVTHHKRDKKTVSVRTCSTTVQAALMFL